MEAQRLRNMTTGKLHTEMRCIYQDLEFITGENGLMTHMLPRVMDAVRPWLKSKVDDERFWDGQYDPTHEGEFPLDPMGEAEKAAAFQRYAAMPDPLVGKNVTVVVTE